MADSRTDDPGDVADDAEGHEQTSRSNGTPYTQAGRDERGEPQPGVPHEGALVTIGRSVVIGQSVVLLAVAITGIVLIATRDSPGRTTVLGLGMSLGHAALLIVTAVVALAACWKKRSLRFYAVGQALLYLLVFFVGTSLSTGVPDRTGLDLNTQDHILHGALAVIGFIVMMVVSARVVEPPPGPVPYPQAESGRDPRDSESETSPSSGSGGSSTS
jgi:uncharacterized protein DUF4383